MNEINVTTEYDRFKLIAGNRPVSEVHVKRLMESMQVKYLMSPILVNSSDEIIDGQHRHEAAKRLGLPIYYVQYNGYGLPETQLLNTNNRNWSKTEYLDSYCKKGVESYLRLKEFMEAYPDFSLSASEVILTNNYGGMNTKKGIKVEGVKVAHSKLFQQGKLVIDNLKAGYDNAAKVMEYKPYFSGFNHALFVRTIIALFKNKNFHHDEMIRKLQIQPKTLVHCITGEQYKLLLEDIYNYRNHNKINLRY